MWKCFSISFKDYFLNFNYENDVLAVVLTDLIYSWKETLSKETINERFKEINSCDGDIEADKVVSIFTGDLDPENSQVDKDIEIINDTCRLALTSKCKDISYTFSLRKSTPEEFFSCITLPLLLMIQELNTRQDKLQLLLKEKDEEITEYQLEGGKLFRRYLKTKKFSEEDFAKECSTNAESVLLASLNNIKTIFNGYINSVYHPAVKVSENYENIKKCEASTSNSCASGVDTVEAKQDAKPKTLKWDLGPQNVKRFKTNRAKMKF